MQQAVADEVAAPKNMQPNVMVKKEKNGLKNHRQIYDKKDYQAKKAQNKNKNENVNSLKQSIAEFKARIKAQLLSKPDNQVPAVPPIPKYAEEQCPIPSIPDSKPVVSLVIKGQGENEPDPPKSKENTDLDKLQDLMRMNEIFKMEINFNIFKQSH